MVLSLELTNEVFCPRLMDTLYQERVVYKKKMIEAQKMYQQTGDKKYEFEIAKNHNIQLGKKDFH